MKKFYIIPLLFLLCTCTHNLNEKTITVFKGYDIEKFIRERFVDRVSLPNRFALFLDRVLPLPDRGLLSKRDELRRKNFIYKAYFTDANSSYLTMPTDDLRLFCRQGDGDFLQTKKFQKDYFVRKDFYPVTHFYAVDDKVISEMEIMIKSENSLPSDARRAYRDVYERGYFGDFVCMVAGKEIWAVAIHPIGFSPKDNRAGANQLGNANLLLLQIMPLVSHP
jgi:hypothetical protein